MTSWDNLVCDMMLHIDSIIEWQDIIASSNFAPITKVDNRLREIAGDILLGRKNYASVEFPVNADPDLIEAVKLYLRMIDCLRNRNIFDDNCDHISDQTNSPLDRERNRLIDILISWRLGDGPIMYCYLMM